MRSEYFYALLIFIPLAIIQLTVLPFIRFNQVVPDLILILLVYYSIRMGQIHGTILGALFGLLFDIISGGIIGSMMFSKALSGFFAGYFSNENKMDQYLSSYMFLLIVFLIGTIDSIVYSFFTTSELNTNLFSLVFNQGIIPGFYTAILALPMMIFAPKKMAT